METIVKILFLAAAPSIDGVAGFEIFVPWSSVYPYGPRFFKRIGFNLCFVKAEGSKSYFLKPDERMQWEQSPRGLLPLADEFERLASAPASEWRGTYRRAYELGGELFPYSIHVPEDYSPTKKYPLMVWLHGSGEDDRSLANAFKPDGFIVVAPGGRNVSNCFATVSPCADVCLSLAGRCELPVCADGRCCRKAPRAGGECDVCGR